MSGIDVASNSALLEVVEKLAEQNSILSDGAITIKGEDGITPHIGGNGNWYIGDTDTGVRAEALAEGATVVQTTGDSTTSVMSQASVTEALDKIAGAIEVSEPVVGDYSNIMMYDKDGNETTDFGKAHSGLFRVYVQQQSGSSVVQYGNKYLLMEQTVARTSGNTSANLVTQTILIGDKLLSRSFDHIANILTEDGEFINSCGDFTQIDLEAVQNKSTVIDDNVDDIKYPTTKAVKDYVDEKDIYVDTKTVYLGDDVLGSASLGDGWSETNGVYTHSTGYIADLTFETEVEENSTYILEFDTSYTANEYIRVGIGDRYRILCYKGSATHVTVPLMASGGTTLYFTPYNDTYAGSISNITLRKIQENGEKRELEIYSTATDNHTQNYGFWNTFIGHDTAENAVGTTRSIAIGAYTLRDLQGGHRNIGIGTFAMSQLIGGEENISIGADSMLAVKNAEACVAMGMAAMYEGASRKGDIAIGRNALRGTGTSETSGNVALGENAGLKVTTAKSNVLIGNNAGYNMKTGNNNVFAGVLAGRNADSYGCVAIGSQADTEGFSQSTAIGYLAKATKSKQVVLGNDNTVETLLKGDVVVRGTDGVQRTIELSTNKSTVIDDTANDTKYPTTKAVKDYVDNSIPFEKDLSSIEPVNIIESVEIGLEVGKSWMSGSFTTHGGKPYSNQYTSGYTAFSEAIDVMEGHTYLIPSFVGTVDLYGDGASYTRILSQGSIKNAEFTVPEGMNKMGVSYRHEYISTPTAIYRTSLTEEETENIAICSENFSLLPKNLKNKEAISLLAPLKGKTIVNFGDSIFGNARPPQDVSTYIAELTGATVHNCAFGGCRMAQHVGHYDAFSMYRLAYAIANNDYSVQDEAIAYSDRTSYAEEPLALLKSIDFSKVDIITIAYGTNDWTGLGKKPDNSNDLHDTTYFGGALRYSIETLLNAYPNLKIFLCCPTYRFWVDSNNAFTEDSDTRLESNHTLIEYIECMQEIAKSYHLPFIDNYYSLGINKYNRSLYFSASDGAHHLEPGRRLIASHIAKELF